MVGPNFRRLTDAIDSTPATTLAALLAVLLFLFAVQLLGTSTPVTVIR